MEDELDTRAQETRIGGLSLSLNRSAPLRSFPQAWIGSTRGTASTACAAGLVAPQTLRPRTPRIIGQVATQPVDRDALKQHQGSAIWAS